MLDKAEQQEITARRFQSSGETARYQATEAELDSLRYQVAQKRQQLERTTVRSPISGLVDRPQLHNLLGSYVAQGTALASISPQSSKEIQVSFDQSDLSSVRRNVGREVAILLPGFAKISGVLQQIDPRASLVPPHPSMLVNYGGRLPVKLVSTPGKPDSSAYQLTAPRLTAKIFLAPGIGNQLQAGQRGRVFFRATDQSRASWCYQCIAAWIKKKLGYNPSY